MFTLVGIDAGGTSSKILVGETPNLSTAEFGEIARENIAGANLFMLGEDNFKERCQEIAEIVLKYTKSLDNTFILFGGAGLISQDMKDVAAQNLAAAGFDLDKITVVDDAELLLKVFKDGVVLITGTGCVSLAKKGDRISRSGGGGPLLGDNGSGFDLGLKALRAVFQATNNQPFKSEGEYYEVSENFSKIISAAYFNPEENYEPYNLEHSLRENFLYSFQKNDKFEIDNEVRQRVASLAPYVMDIAATHSDQLASSLVKELVDDMAMLIIQAWKNCVGPNTIVAPPRVGLQGGLWNHAHAEELLFIPLIQNRLLRAYGNIEWVRFVEDKPSLAPHLSLTTEIDPLSRALINQSSLWANLGDLNIVKHELTSLPFSS